MSKSTGDILLDYQKLKERESENKLRGFLIKTGNMISSSVASGIQNGLRRDTDIGKVVSGLSLNADIKKIDLSTFVNGLGGFLGKIQAFANSSIGKKKDYAKQAGPINDIIGTVALLNTNSKNLKNCHDDKQGSLANSLIQFVKFGRMTSSVGAQAFKYDRLLHSSQNFSYWLGGKLVKRRMLQEDLLVFSKIAKDLKLAIDIKEIEPKGLNELRSNLFYRSEELVKEQLDNLSVKDYGERLSDHVKKLEDVFKKHYMTSPTPQERDYFEKNKQLIAFLGGTNNLQTSRRKAGEEPFFDEKRLLAFVNHLEQKHALDLLRQREELIKNRVIAELDKQVENTKKSIIKLLILEETFEMDLVDQVGDYNQSFRQFAQRQSVTKKEKENAQHINNNYKKALDAKIETEQKSLIGKSLILVATGLLVAGLIAIFACVRFALVVPLIVCAEILFLVGQKLSPLAVNDLVTDISSFFGKFKKEVSITKVMKEIQNESKGHPLAVMLAEAQNTQMRKLTSEYEYEEEDYEEGFENPIQNSESLIKKPQVILHSQDDEDVILSEEELGLLLSLEPNPDRTLM